MEPSGMDKESEVSTIEGNYKGKEIFLNNLIEEKLKKKSWDEKYKIGAQINANRNEIARRQKDVKQELERQKRGGGISFMKRNLKNEIKSEKAKFKKYFYENPQKHNVDNQPIKEETGVQLLSDLNLKESIDNKEGIEEEKEQYQQQREIIEGKENPDFDKDARKTAAFNDPSVVLTDKNNKNVNEKKPNNMNPNIDFEAPHPTKDIKDENISSIIRKSKLERPKIISETQEKLFWNLAKGVIFDESDELSIPEPLVTYNLSSRLDSQSSGKHTIEGLIRASNNEKQYKDPQEDYIADISGNSTPFNRTLDYSLTNKGVSIEPSQRYIGNSEFEYSYSMEQHYTSSKRDLSKILMQKSGKLNK